ncbi:MAG: TMEM175 family protein [Bauldia sp.]
MGKGRLEAFSDGVIAIIITILVLELKVPHGTELNALVPFIPAFISYVLSFVYLGIYWNNHHHLLQAGSHVNGLVLWANLHLLFWLSLIPFVTGWMGENEFATLPVAVYGFDLLMAALAYYLLERTLIAAQGEGSRLKMAVGAEIKGWVSVVFYIVGILVALFWTPWVGLGLYGFVALMWLVPDRRIERALARSAPTK